MSVLGIILLSILFLMLGVVILLFMFLMLEMLMDMIFDVDLGEKWKRMVAGQKKKATRKKAERQDAARAKDREAERTVDWNNRELLAQKSARAAEVQNLVMFWASETGVEDQDELDVARKVLTAARADDRYSYQVDKLVSDVKDLEETVVGFGVGRGALEGAFSSVATRTGDLMVAFRAEKAARVNMVITGRDQA